MGFWYSWILAACGGVRVLFEKDMMFSSSPCQALHHTALEQKR